MKVPFVLLLIVLLTTECVCRRGGGGSRSRGRSGSRSHGSSGGGFWSWFGFGRSKSSSSSESKPIPSAPVAPPSAPKSPPNNNPIGFENFGQGGNRYMHDHNNNMFASNIYQSGPYKYKDNKLNSGGIVPIPVPIPIGSGSSYHHYGSSGSYSYRHNNITNNRTTETNRAPLNWLNPGFLNPDSLYFPYKPGYLYPKPGDESRNSTSWNTGRDWYLKYGNGTSLNAFKPAAV